MAEIRATEYNWFDPTGDVAAEFEVWDETHLDRTYIPGDSEES